MFRNLLWALSRPCVVFFILFWPAVTSAITVGGYTLANTAFADTLLEGVGAFTGNAALPGAITDMSADSYITATVDNAYVSLGFSDNALVNGPGDDLVLFEIGMPDSLSVSLVADSPAVTYTSVDTGEVTNSGFSLNAVAIDLDDLGVPANAALSSIVVHLGPNGADLSLVAAMNTAAGPVVPVQLAAGDLAPVGNPDGLLNSADVTVLQRMILGDIDPSPAQRMVGDIAPLNQGDGQLDTADILVLERAVLGQIDLQPVVLPGSLDPPYLVPPSGSVNQPTITVNGVSAPGQNVNLYLDDVLFASVTADGQGVFQATATLQPGPNNIHAKVLSGSQESAPSNLVAVFYNVDPAAADWQKITVTDQGGGQVVVNAQPGAVAAGAVVSLTTRSGGSATVTANPDGSFSAALAGANGVDEPVSIAIQDASGHQSKQTGNYAVGSLSGTFIVSETGAATYTIPIDVPPGVAGMQPELALSYNSQSGNGLLGVGWRLEGLSAITRCPRTYAQDGAYGSINFDANDRFCLDGQRLVSISGAYGSDGTTYRTEVDDFSLITQNGDSCGGPCGFTVQTKSGQTLVYGNSDNSRITVSTVAAAQAWTINHISDITGNTIWFDYYKNQYGDHRIKRIRYQNSSVDFVYQARPDIRVNYLYGTAARTENRLSNITTRVNGAPVRDYGFAYGTGGSSGLSRIVSISECGYERSGKKICLPPTRFQWLDGQIAFEAYTDSSTIAIGATTDLVSPRRDNTWVGDFDGDGRQELATRDDSGGFVTITDAAGRSFRLLKWPVTAAQWGANVSTWPGDFDGDGVTDLASLADKVVYVKLSTGGGFEEKSWPVPIGYNAGYTWSGDFNGDGRTDLASLYTLGVYVLLSNGNGFDATWHGAGPWGASEYSWTGDFNGDGLTDLASAIGSDVYVKLSTSSGFDFKTWSVSGAGSANWGPGNKTWVRDVNGDGLSDIVTVQSTQTAVTVYVRQSTGVGFVLKKYVLPPGNVVRAEDFNGDGLLDLWILVDNTGKIAKGVAGGGFSIGAFGGYQASWDSQSNLFTMFADFDGDGDLDQAIRFLNTLTVSDALVGDDLVSTISPGVGATIDVSYGALPNIVSSDLTYLRPADCGNYPVRCTPPSVQVVSRQSVGDGIGGVSRFSYGYLGPRTHSRGRGFLGFKSTSVTDEQTGITTTTAYAVELAQTTVDGYPDRYPYAGMASSITATQVVAPSPPPPGKVVAANLSMRTVYDSMEVTQFDLKKTGVGTYFPYCRVKVEKKREINGYVVSTTTTTTDYDDYGNATRIDAQIVGNGQTFRKTTINQYDPTRLRLGRLTRAEVTSTTPDGTATRVSAFDYYPNGLLRSETIEPDQPDTSTLKQTTTYEYDGYGNRTSVTVTALSADTAAQGFQSRVTRTVYDAAGLYPIRTINALGHEESYQYDPRFGLRTQLIGPNHLATRWEYDAFGRQIRELRADGTQTTTRFAWCPISQCPNGGTQVITETSGAPRSVVYKDDHDREIRAESEGLQAGSIIVQDTAYDRFGRISRKSRPYYQGDTPQWARFFYDQLDRVVQEDAPDGGQVLYSYGPLTKTATTKVAGGDVTELVRTETYDVLNRLVSVVEPGGVTTTFAYDALDNRVQVTDSAGNTTRMQYDIRGRKIAMDDPDMGHWDYRYNGFGELVFQQDNKLQQVRMGYDALGRRLTRDEAEGLTRWIYDTAPNGVGKLSRVTGPESYRRELGYDGLGRLETDTRYLSGQALSLSYAYDRFGRVVRTTYPSGFAVTNVYDSHGYLTAVRNAVNDALYWQADAADADGNVTLETLGNGLITARSYDPASGRLRLLTTGTASPGDSSIQHLGYTFDTLGNLQSRTRSEGVTSLTETFDYDGLNRLRSATLVGIGTRNYDYDALGNITRKGKAADYKYVSADSGGGPHAVSYAAGQSYRYDANGNMISGAGRTIAWSSFNKPTSIQKGQVRIHFDYGPDRSRYQQVRTTEAGTTTILYVGKLYEQVTRQGQVERRHYIVAGSKTVAIYTDKGAGVTQTRYLHHDHLGSVAVITDEQGGVVERLSFSAFGARRNLDWTTATTVLTSQVTTRGFTGHEQLDDVGLVHMNGRVYDPLLGRFLSADPQVQFPASSQSYNRYSYVNNNPLSYTDPSGFGLFKKIKNVFKKVGSAIKKALRSPVVRAIAAIVISYYTFGYFAILSGSGVVGAAAGGFVGGYIATGTLRGAAIGAVTAVAFYGVGTGFERLARAGNWGAGSRYFGKVVAHGTVGGISSRAQGGSFADGFRSAGFTQFASPVVGTVPGGVVGRTAAAAVVGGTASRLGGGKFTNGAQTGAFSRLFSEALSTQSKGIRGARAQVRGRQGISILGSTENPFALPDGPRIQVADTYGISFNFTGGAAAGGTGGYLFVVDDSLNFELYRTVGGGALAGASLSFTADLEFTDALSVDDLAGVASQIGVSAGTALVGETGIILGPGYKGSYYGLGVGAGTPASGIGFAVDAQPLTLP